jgi:hypothetical protein
MTKINPLLDSQKARSSSRSELPANAVSANMLTTAVTGIFKGLHVNKTNVVFWHRSCRPEKPHRPGFLTPGEPISVSRLEWKF